jgi:hypothetical protein
MKAKATSFCPSFLIGFYGKALGLVPNFEIEIVG